MWLIPRGYADEEVAKELFIWVTMVEPHRSSVLRRPQLSSHHELTQWVEEAVEAMVETAEKVVSTVRTMGRFSGSDCRWSRLGLTYDREPLRCRYRCCGAG